jgi:hypothetical protein
MRRNPLVLAGVLLVLVLVIFLLVRPDHSRKADEQESLALYPGLDTSRVDRVQIHSKEADVDLFRDDEGWKVASEDSFPADPGGLERIVEAVAKLTDDEVVSRLPEKYDLFQVDSAQAVEVSVHADGEQQARFFIGKSGPDFSSTYLRDSEREEVFLQPDPLKGVFDRGTRTWRDKTIFDLEEEQMAELRLVRGDTTVVFQNRWEEGWVVSEPEGYQPLAGLAQGMARGLTNLTASDFGKEDEWEAAGFDEPKAEARITMVDESVRTLWIGNEKEGGGGHYVKRDSDEVLYLVPKARVSHYLRPVDQLIEPIPPDTTGAADTSAVFDSLSTGSEE